MLLKCDLPKISTLRAVDFADVVCVTVLDYSFFGKYADIRYCKIIELVSII